MKPQYFLARLSGNNRDTVGSPVCALLSLHLLLNSVLSSVMVSVLSPEQRLHDEGMLNSKKDTSPFNDCLPCLSVYDNNRTVGFHTVKS